MQIDVLATNLAFPEGPAFAPDGSLWLVEIPTGMLTHWQPTGLHRHDAGGNPNGLAFDRAGHAWVCDAGRAAVRTGDLASGTWQTVVDSLDGNPILAPNDLAFDRHGNCVFTCPGEGERGDVCCLRRDGTVLRVATDLCFPNGLAFIDDGQTLVVAETHRKRLWRGTWDPATSMWLDPYPWTVVGGTTDGPDGIAVGADGRLYVAVYSLGCIVVVAPEGQVVERIALPGRNPTNCAFDPSGRLGLVVTEAEHGLLLSLPQLGPGLPLYLR